MLTDTQAPRWTFPAKPDFRSINISLIALAVATVFVLDWFTPLGITIPCFYILILWIALARTTPRQAFVVIAVSSVLTVVGLFPSPGDELRMDLTNRAITLVTLWFLAYFGMAYRKTVDALCTRERQLRDFVENAPVGIHWVAPNGTILWVNQEELDTLGYAREEYVGRNVIDFHVDRKMAGDILAQLNANAPVKDWAARLRHKNGSIRHVLISCNISQEDGRFIHSRCFTQDITDRVRAELAESESRQLAAEAAERKLVEKALQESEERFALFMQHLPGAVFIKDGDGRYVFANPVTEKAMQTQPGGWRGRTDADLYPPATARQFRDSDLHALSTGQTVKAVEALYHDDGIQHWLTVKFPISSNAGPLPLLGGIAIDITAVKHTEEALLESERRLRQSLDEREHLSWDLHDHVIQAIYAIGMQLEACRRLLRDNPQEAATQLMQTIHGLNGVIRDVRRYIAGSESQILGKSRLRAELVKLVEAIGATGSLRFRLKLDPVAVSRLTPQQTEQVLYIAREALSNALRYSHAKHGELSLHVTDAGVRLKIREDGVGFDPDAAARAGGGLHNMQSRAQQIGGRIEILSLPGHGATIILHVPQENTAHDIY